MITEISVLRIYELLAPFIERLEHEKAMDAVHELADRGLIAPWQLTGIVDCWARAHEERSRERQAATSKVTITDVERQ